MANGSGTHPWHGLIRAVYSTKAVVRGLLCAVASALILMVAAPSPVAHAAAPPGPVKLDHWVLSCGQGRTFNFATVQIPTSPNSQRLTPNAHPPPRGTSSPAEVVLTGRADPALDAWRRSGGGSDRRDCVLTGNDAKGVAHQRYKLTGAWITKLEFASSKASPTVVRVTLATESITVLPTS
jgi:hypothetical protein